MGEWLRSSLGEVAQLRFGKTPPRNELRFWNPPIGHPWATIADMRTDPVLHTSETVSEAGLPFAGRKVPAGSVMMSFKLTVGRVARAGTELLTNEAIVSIHGLEGRVDDGWLYHALPGIARRGVTDTAVKGSTLNKAKLEKLKVDLPPLEEQRRIADVLNAVDESIQATERLVAKHEKLRDGLASDLLWDSRLDKNLVPIGDIGEVIGGGTPSRERADYWDGSIPWVTPGELTGTTEKYVFETRESISELGLSKSGATMLPEGSLLMTSRASIGSCALAGVPMATNQGFQNIVPCGDVDPSYLLHVGRGLHREMVRRASGTTFLEITGREFSRINIHLPSLPEQRRIASILDTADETIHRNEAQLAKLRRLRSGLAADLLSGRVRTKAA